MVLLMVQAHEETWISEGKKSQNERWRGLCGCLCVAIRGSIGISSSGIGVFDWRELDMLKLNKPIRRTKRLEVKTHAH